MSQERNPSHSNDPLPVSNDPVPNGSVNTSPNVVEAKGDGVTIGRLMQMAWGFAPVYIIQAAIETGLFDAVKNGPLSGQDITDVTRCSARGTYALLNALVGLRLLEKRADKRFELAPEALKFLVNENPETNLVSFFKQLTLHAIPNWVQLAQCVRTGRPSIAVNRENSGAPFFANFSESLFALNYPAAEAFASKINHKPDTAYRILDVGAGTAVWSIPIARRLSAARVAAVDWIQVITGVTSRFVDYYGLTAKYEMLPGDIMDVDFGKGYDLAILGLILHTEGEARSRLLLSKIYDSLAAGGKIVVVEFLVDQDRKQPLDGLLFALNMLVHSDAGDTWSYEELLTWLEDAGFKNIEAVKVPRPSPLILGTKPL